jgi:hypothetical protein
MTEPGAAAGKPARAAAGIEDLQPAAGKSGEKIPEIFLDQRQADMSLVRSVHPIFQAAGACIKIAVGAALSHGFPPSLQFYLKSGITMLCCTLAVKGKRQRNISC